MTGRLPIIAAPIATPHKPFSAIGISMIRSGAMCSGKPLIVPKTAVGSATPSARKMTDRSFLATSIRPSRIASPVLRLPCSAMTVRVHDLRRLRRVGQRRGLGESERGVDLGLQRLGHALLFRFGQEVKRPQLPARELDRVLGAPLLVFVERAVAELIVVVRPAVLPPAVGV